MMGQYVNLIGNTTKIEKYKIPSDLAPVVLFTYNRLEHIKRTIYALQLNIYAKDSQLFIYSDASKNKLDEKKVQKVREFLHSISGFKKVCIVERTENWGLAKNIISGVTKIVNKFGKIIVLEDDIITSKYFLKYMNDALKVYEFEYKIMQISGTLIPFHQLNRNIFSMDTFFSTSTQTWGWATWKNRWQYFERNPEQLIKTYTKEMKKKFDESNWPGSWRQVLDNYEGKIYTWGIFFHATIFEHKGVIVYPKYILAANIGFDGSGENCGLSDYFNANLEEKLILNFEKNTLSVNKTQDEIHTLLYKDKETLLKNAKKATRVFCYGAGEYGKLMQKFLLNHSLYIEEYVISKREKNPLLIEGIPVSLITDISFQEGDFMIVSISEKMQNTVRSMLDDKILKNSFFITEILMEEIVDENNWIDVKICD
ncbi:glycosyltransferase [Pectinatus frisingensis]|uniref:glycosyltransferase n=1 Tax=Pectinatus frisingensis TaxID=865 RepID=UPI0018C61EA3|nr:glycosyltransferase [Pectinatus frisingensis]